MINRIFFGILLLSVVNCAHIPRQSVELSSAIGNDLVSAHKSHRELAEVLFNRIKQDINRFIDNVYAPYQVNKLMSRQQELASSSDPNDQKKALFLALDSMVKPGATPQFQENVRNVMGSMIKRLHADIETMRQQLLAPIDSQETLILNSINTTYLRMEYANTVVTENLASMYKLHEAQCDLLKGLGVNPNLSDKIGGILSATSTKVNELVSIAETADNKLEGAEKTAEKIKNEITNLGAELNTGGKENDK